MVRLIDSDLIRQILSSYHPSPTKTSTDPFVTTSANREGFRSQSRKFFLDRYVLLPNERWGLSTPINLPAYAVAAGFASLLISLNCFIFISLLFSTWNRLRL